MGETERGKGLGWSQMLSGATSWNVRHKHTHANRDNRSRGKRNERRSKTSGSRGSEGGGKEDMRCDGTNATAATHSQTRTQVLQGYQLDLQVVNDTTVLRSTTGWETNMRQASRNMILIKTWLILSQRISFTAKMTTATGTWPYLCNHQIIVLLFFPSLNRKTPVFEMDVWIITAKDKQLDFVWVVFSCDWTQRLLLFLSTHWHTLYAKRSIPQSLPFLILILFVPADAPSCQPATGESDPGKLAAKRYFNRNENPNQINQRTITLIISYLIRMISLCVCATACLPLIVISCSG